MSRQIKQNSTLVEFFTAVKLQNCDKVKKYKQLDLRLLC